MTGVQTCALPIFGVRAFHASRGELCREGERPADGASPPDQSLGKRPVVEVAELDQPAERSIGLVGGVPAPVELATELDLGVRPPPEKAQSGVQCRSGLRPAGANSWFRAARSPLPHAAESSVRRRSPAWASRRLPSL